MKRYVYYLLGMNILVLGITCNTLSNLGVGAFSALPFALSSLSALTFGQANIIFYLLSGLSPHPHKKVKRQDIWKASDW